MSSEYITKIRTNEGDKQIDYRSIANLPTPPSYELLFEGSWEEVTEGTVEAVLNADWYNYASIYINSKFSSNSADASTIRELLLAGMYIAYYHTIPSSGTAYPDQYINCFITPLEADENIVYAYSETIYTNLFQIEGAGGVMNPSRIIRTPKIQRNSGKLSYKFPQSTNFTIKIYGLKKALL